ncbi:TraI domain-containing protein, partial [bacterium]|nr:TraI domain-containing protein [bacterium]
MNSGPRLVSIKKHSGCDEETFNELYLNPIYRFAEVCQLQPASAADHHSGLGGLLTHTLEVIDIAMSLRKAYHLPVNADTETVRREEPDWTYGVFVAALLHDAG